MEFSNAVTGRGFRVILGIFIVGTSMSTWLGAMTHAEDSAITGQAAFDRLKRLVGAWEGKVDGMPAPGILVTYATTAAGSVVVETLFPGTDHEMITMYHQQGEDLVLTHYCAAGNQPRMTLDRKVSRPDAFHFEFSGGTNVDEFKDVHMHSGRLRFQAEDVLECEWIGYKAGKPVGSHIFSLLRKKG